MRKSQTAVFLLLLFYIGKLTFCWKRYLKKPSLYSYIGIAVFSRGRLLEMQCSPTPIQIFIVFADSILRSKVLGNRLGISTQILLAEDYFFYLYISDKYLQFKKKKAINFIIKSITKEIGILAKRLLSFSIIVFRMKFLVILFIRKKKHLLGNIFGSPHTSNRIYLLRNFFSSYVYLKDMYITLKSIGKILFVSVLRIC